MIRVLSWLLLAPILSAGCTGSENQLFSPFERNTPPPTGVDAGLADAGEQSAIDSASPLDEDDAGVLLLNPALDPDIDFDWVETQPGHPGACEPGRYTGSFECASTDESGLGRLAGSIALTLAPGTDSKLLEISKGEMIGFAGGTNELFSASLQGELACTSAEFMSTTIKASVYPFPGFGGGFTSVKLHAALDGKFDAEALSIHGDVVVTSDSGWQCDGMFTVRISR